MRQRNSDMLVAIAIAVLNIVEAFLPTRIFLVSVTLALPLVFFVPGYVLIEMIAIKRTLDTFHRIIFGIGLSITLDILGGFLLNMLPAGLRTQSWVVLLGSFTLLFALCASICRRGHNSLRPVSDSPRWQELRIVHNDGKRNSRGRGRNELWPLLRGGAVLSLAVILVIVALVYAANGVAQQPRTGFTQLWILPPTQSEQQCIVYLGVRSFELTPVTYHATLSVNTVRKVVWPSIALAPNQTWSQPILVPTNSMHVALIEVNLYKGNNSTSVYRQVHMTLHFSETGTIFHCV